ncbi:MAG TPA: DUF4215 domain-containing protein [Kofleriaceae bacterium]
MTSPSETPATTAPAPPPAAPAKPATPPADPAPPARAVCGNGTVEAGEQCDDGNTRSGDGCSSRCLTEVASGPITIDPSALKPQRISGNDDVQPSKATRAAMIRNGVGSVKGVVRLCVDTTGLVTESALTERTGYTDYDSKLLENVHGWHYRPFLLNGSPVAVCSTVEFIYSPQ